jgi:VWFA-related protein
MLIRFMMLRCRRSAGARAIASFLAFLCADFLNAQAPDASRPVQTSVETVAAEIEVLILDAKGIPIEGLTKDDFKLFVNGKETPIDFFEAPPAIRAPEAGPPAANATEAANTVPAPQRRAHSTVFVISDLHTDARARNAGLDALRTYADGLPEGEPAAVYLLDAGVRRLQPFTADRATLKKALERTAKMLPRSYVFDDVRGDEWVGQSRQMLRNFTTVLDSLASRPEPKTIVVLTGPISAQGLIKPIGDDSTPSARARAMNDPETAYAARGFWNFLAEAKDAESQALLARATIVAFDPAGLDSPNAKAEINSMQTDLSRMVHTQVRPGDSVGQETSRPSSLRQADASSESDKQDTWEFRNDTLALLAESTGGSRLGFSNEPARLLLDESRLLARRYRLGFTPPDGTSARREIRVTVTHPGVVVRTASGQRSPAAETAARSRFAGLLLSGEAPAGDFSIGVEMKGPVKKRTDDALPFDILVPLSGVYAEEVPDGKRARLELLIAGVDEEGRSSALTVIPFAMTLGKGASDGAFFRKDSHFVLDRRWKGRLFIGVRDTATNRLGAAAIPIG